MKKFYFVLAENAGEGVVFDDKNDADYALTGEINGGGFGISVLAEAFQENYGGEDNISMITVEI